MTTNKAIIWSSIWIASAILFSIVLGKFYSPYIAMEFLSCYAVEKMLSFDNLLMFYVIFRYFNSSNEQQRKALNVGLYSAFALRAIMIFSGGFLLHQYSWLSYLFGGFLLYSGGQLLINSGDEPEPPEKMINFIRTKMPWISYFGVIVCAVELTDVLFALDSIPASFGVSGNPIVIFSANVFAILGLRSLYFIMQNLIKRFVYLEQGVAVILALVGIRMLLEGWFNISISYLFAAISVILITVMFFSNNKDE